METVVPEARSKAAAFDSYIAQGGRPFKMSGKFRQGPMKGLTIDQARAQFERTWASASDEVKNKYASRSLVTDLAPMERDAYRTVQGSSPTPPGTVQAPGTPAPQDMSAAGMQKRRMAAHGFQFDKDGNAVRIGSTSTVVAPVAPQPEAIGKRAGGTAGAAMGGNAVRIGTPAPVAAPQGQGIGQRAGGAAGTAMGSPAGARAGSPTLAELTKAPVVPAGGTISVGDGSTAENGWQPQNTPQPAAPTVPGSTMPVTAPVSNVGNLRQADEQRIQSVPASTPQDPNRGKFGYNIADDLRAAGTFLTRPNPHNAAAVAEYEAKHGPGSANPGNSLYPTGGAGGVKPVVAPVSAAAPAPVTARAVVTPPPTSSFTPPTPNSPEKAASDVAYGKIADERMSPGGPAAPRTVATPSPPTGRPVMSYDDAKAASAATKSPVNRLTGLPAGFVPGDTIDGANSTMQRAADDSVRRQQDAPRAMPAVGPTPGRPSTGLPGAQSAPNNMIAGIKPTPAPDRYKAAQEGYQASQLDPAKAREMDAVYAGANSRDQATITAQSLKRAASLPVPPRSVVTPPQPRKQIVPGLARPRFAMAGR